MAAVTRDLTIEEVERRVLRGIVAMRVDRLRDRGPAGYAKTSWGQDLLDGATMIEAAFRSGKAYRKALKLTARDLEDFDFLSQHDSPGRWVPPWRVTAQDLEDYPTATAWWAALARLPSKRRPQVQVSGNSLPRDRDQLIIWWFASGYEMEHIARRLSCARGTAERRYGKAIADCWRIANGAVQLQDFEASAS
jgi:hypothetical protein